MFEPVVLFCVLGVGIVIGMYVVSQIDNRK